MYEMRPEEIMSHDTSDQIRSDIPGLGETFHDIVVLRYGGCPSLGLFRIAASYRQRKMSTRRSGRR